MFSDKRFIVYVYVYQKQVIYAHIRKVKFPKTIHHTSRVAYNFYSGRNTVNFESTRQLLDWNFLYLLVFKIKCQEMKVSAMNV